MFWRDPSILCSHFNLRFQPIYFISFQLDNRLCEKYFNEQLSGTRTHEVKYTLWKTLNLFSKPDMGLPYNLLWKGRIKHVKTFSRGETVKHPHLRNHNPSSSQQCTDTIQYLFRFCDARIQGFLRITLTTHLSHSTAHSKCPVSPAARV